jgi:hypothetical protein
MARRATTGVLASVHAKCSKTARVTKYGAPYTLICARSKGHAGKCRDIDNDVWFEAEEKP